MRATGRAGRGQRPGAARRDRLPHRLSAVARSPRATAEPTRRVNARK
ncbi:hypothetical protein ATKI12_3617 [Kitasatospora sp. Ki12]